MTVTATSFRGAFNAFGNQEAFPGPEVDFWIALATQLHDADRWGGLLDNGIMFFIAHNLSLESGSKQAAAAGQQPGQVLGALTSVSVDKVSYSRDPGSAMDPGNGHWNLTHYGLRWKQLARMIGAGPIQIGAGPDGPNFSAAWPGPFPTGMN